jgi:hypothetical protein
MLLVTTAYLLFLVATAIALGTVVFRDPLRCEADLVVVTDPLECHHIRYMIPKDPRLRLL